MLFKRLVVSCEWCYIKEVKEHRRERLKSMSYGRSVSHNSKLAGILEKLGWAALAFNVYTLMPYFWQVIKGDWLAKGFGTAIMLAIILGMEFVAVDVLFNPIKLVGLLDRPRGETSEAQASAVFVQWAAILILATLTAGIFWFDFSINMAQLSGGVSKIVKDTSLTSVDGNLIRQIIAAVFVASSEILFNAASMLGDSDSDSRNSRKNEEWVG
jgi:hypothetical protein